MSDRPIAHVRFDAQGKPIEHWLDEHLQKVAQLASGYATDFKSHEWAYVAGLWHDLGKYNPAFQDYICDKTGYERENAHIELANNSKGKVNHSAAGALYAVKQHKQLGLPLAYLIAGHHAGLPDWTKTAESEGRSLAEILEETEHLDKALQVDVPSSILKQPLPKTAPRGESHEYALWIRMLFSSLVDADFLDTEAFMQPQQFAQRGKYPDLATLLQRFNEHMQSFAVQARPSKVNELRTQVLQQCRAAAQQPSGIFSLTVPTGGGKTLSGMAFALEQAVKYQKKRIIYAIPFTSIIEQTATIYRSILGDCVIEHHSNLDVSDPERETAQSRLASENWDAPIIVTTNVQLFESLFASRTSRCRKLHNLANSVIVLDEAQLLPPEFLNPILSIMKSLVAHYGVTFVLSTATQPALQSLYDPFNKPILKGFDAKQVTEIIPNCEQLFNDLERVTVVIPDDLSLERNWEDIAAEMMEHEAVLVIVNTKSQAAELCRLLPPDTYYLSTNLCGAHRSEKLQEIRDKLKTKQPLRVVSTQLIEAGVDVDFPVVYRALTGLDSIAQAAGRCNREGLLTKGKVIVFIPPNNHKLKGHLGLSASVSKSLLPLFTEPPLYYRHFKTYFEHYYTKTKSRDAQGIEELLTKDARSLKIQFRTAANRFRLIKEEGHAVLVPYGEGEKLIEQLKILGSSRWLLRKLQRYTVTIREQDKNRLRNNGDIRELKELAGVYELVTSGIYDSKLGLMSDPFQLDPEDLLW
ncbi:CRISPR-associated helicase/endonuclease Cas3 [Thiofilum flexile]|uniref:CRISPR-associated helicase/endonuclease Cas3 n=1 Tax=Thiofilum flexile TaxID=125627 RepID=UPI00035C5134|nr:CRISPR-associated helicase/endonuclease Cas3 [Thiofilum flexile]